MAVNAGYPVPGPDHLACQLGTNLGITTSNQRARSHGLPLCLTPHTRLSVRQVDALAGGSRWSSLWWQRYANCLLLLSFLSGCNTSWLVYAGSMCAEEWRSVAQKVSQCNETVTSRKIRFCFLQLLWRAWWCWLWQQTNPQNVGNPQDTTCANTQTSETRLINECNNDEKEETMFNYSKSVRAKPTMPTDSSRKKHTAILKDFLFFTFIHE